MLRTTALDPAFFQRTALLPLGGCIHKTKRIRPEQPLVTSGNHEIRLDGLNIKGQCTQRLRRIYDESSANLTAALANGNQINQAAIGPMTVRQGNDAGFVVDAVKDGSGPVAIRRARDGDDNAVAVICLSPTGEDVGGELLLQQHNVLTG